MSDKPMQATRQDLADNARRHYEQISMEVCDWSSTIPKAIDSWEREPDLIAQRDELLEALEEVAKGEGAFSLDPLTHAGNTIENMKAIAQAAIQKAKGEG